MKKLFTLKTMLLALLCVMGVSSTWATDTEVAKGTFNGKNATYTTGWSTTGTGTGRTDCVVIGKDENITSPALDLSSYDEIKITFTGRRFGNVSNSKATVDASIGGTSQGTIDLTETSVGAVSGNISFIPTSSMTSVNIVFTCTNATSAGSTHGAGIGSITITGVKNNAEAYTVTFDAGTNGTCSTTSLAETAANAGVTLPSCTANGGYAFDGWSTSSAATSPDEGLDAGKTYYPTSNIHLYAVYSKVVPFTLVFKESGSDSDSGTKYTSVSDAFSSGESYVSSVSNISNAYPARTGPGAKFGTSKSIGSITINLKKAVTLGKIVVECAGYADGETGGFTINSTNFSSTTYAANGFENLTYNTVGSISAITIATQSKRGYVKSITIYPAGSYDDLTVSAAGYTTYYNSKQKYIVPEGMTTYSFGQNNETLKYGLQEEYSAGGDRSVVPEGVAQVLKAAPGTYTLQFTTESAWMPGNNMLKGTDTEATTTADLPGAKFYALSLNAAGETSSVGFYWMTENGAAFTNGAHKAYLTIDEGMYEVITGGAPKMCFLFNDDDATAITNAKVSKSNDAVIYNLAGQRVAPSAKGILIKNGKKYVNK